MTFLFKTGGTDILSAVLSGILLIGISQGASESAISTLANSWIRAMTTTLPIRSMVSSVREGKALRHLINSNPKNSIDI
jgi:hypothetical protein